MSTATSANNPNRAARVHWTVLSLHQTAMPPVPTTCEECAHSDAWPVTIGTGTGAVSSSSSSLRRHTLCMSTSQAYLIPQSLISTPESTRRLRMPTRAWGAAERRLDPKKRLGLCKTAEWCMHTEAHHHTHALPCGLNHLATTVCQGHSRTWWCPSLNIHAHGVVLASHEQGVMDVGHECRRCQQPWEQS